MAEDYVLDLDPTVKPVYGHQEGAEIEYNPQKPGRPSHCYHTLCIAKLRLVLAVVVHPGNETSGTNSRSMLAEYLAFVSAVKKPRLVRGDVSFGNKSVNGDCEAAHSANTARSEGFSARHRRTDDHAARLNRQLDDIAVTSPRLHW